MKRVILVILLVGVLLLAAGAFWYARQRGYREATPGVSPPTPGISITEPSEKELGYEAIAYSATSNATEIFTATVKDKKRRIVFTDRDEQLKVKAIRQSTDGGRKVLAYLAKKGEQVGTTLGMITIEGTAAVTTLLDNFGATEAPVPSPDGKRVAYVVFSNADPDYGYQLFLMNTDGSNKRRLVKRETLLTQLTFSPDGKKIAFLVDTGKGMAIQTIATEGTSEPKTLAEYANEIVYDLSWGTDLVFGKRPKGDTAANEGEIYRLAESGSGLSKITKNEAFDGSPAVSPDGAMLALVRTTFVEGKYSGSGDLTLIVLNLSDNSETELGAADGVLGWRVAKASPSS